MLGSLDKDRHDADRTQFEYRCRELGAELAQRGCMISVASAAPFTVDLHVLAGANDYCDGRDPVPFEFIGPTDLPPGEPPLEQPTDNYPNLKGRVRLREGGWVEVFETQIEEADGIILVGGNPAGCSAQVARMAIAAGVPILPVRSFYGAGSVAWTQLEPTLSEYGISDSDIRKMGREFDAVRIVDSLVTMVNHLKAQSSNG